MFEIGRIVTKTAGRDGGKKAVIINILDDKYVIIDGATRRKRCNICHLEPSDKVIKISKDAPHEEIKKEFDKLGLKVRESSPKEKKGKPKKIREKKKTKESEKGVKKEKAKIEVKRKKKVKKEIKENIKVEEKTMKREKPAKK